MANFGELDRRERRDTDGWFMGRDGNTDASRRANQTQMLRPDRLGFVGLMGAAMVVAGLDGRCGSRDIAMAGSTGRRPRHRRKARSAQSKG
ncbi:MAG: hypothetical protein FJX52_00380 [Alphaproteobacteria bacterium]|nr:hypothetical protein [Alphaproteobacteria bacterium]